MRLYRTSSPEGAERSARTRDTHAGCGTVVPNRLRGKGKEDVYGAVGNHFSGGRGFCGKMIFSDCSLVKKAYFCQKIVKNFYNQV